MERVVCSECGWKGGWDEVHVELPSGAIGPDPKRRYNDPPYYCPECGEESLHVAKERRKGE